MSTTLRKLASLVRPQLLAVGLGASLLTAALVPGQARGAGPAPTKIAVVDMRRAVMETEDGLRAQSTLRKFFDRRQAELNARQDEILRKREDLEKQSKVLSQAAMQRALEDLQRQSNELQATYADYDRDMQKRQNEITAPIFSRVASLLRKLAQRDGYDLVLERQAVPYARADLDVTDSVIMMYNAGEEGLPEPPQAPSPAGSGSATPRLQTAPAPSPAGSGSSAPAPAAPKP